MASELAAADLDSTMRFEILALILSVLLAGCTHEKSPYTTVDVTNNPPRIDPTLTSNPVVPNPPIQTTNTRSQ